MNVTVIGSHRREQPHLRRMSEFKTACWFIGRKLEEWKHTLVVPHADRPENAETHALAGFRKHGSKQYVECPVCSGDAKLKAHFAAVEQSDAVVLLGGRDGTYAAGLVALRHRKLIIPIPAFGGSAKDLCALRGISHFLSDDIRNLDVDRPKWHLTLSSAVVRSLNAYPRALIIHGRGDTGMELKKRVEMSSLEDDSVLQGLAIPVVMNLRGTGAVSVPDVFEQLAASVSAAIAIVTADDVGGFARADFPDRGDFSARELRLDARARENLGRSWLVLGPPGAPKNIALVKGGRRTSVGPSRRSLGSRHVGSDIGASSVAEAQEITQTRSFTFTISDHSGNVVSQSNVT